MKEEIIKILEKYSEIPEAWKTIDYNGVFEDNFEQVAKEIELLIAKQYKE